MPNDRKHSRRDMLPPLAPASACSHWPTCSQAQLRSRSLDRAANPYAVRDPHFRPRAKRVIFLYMPGGPSHLDLFDPKPRLKTDNAKPLPFEKPKLERTKTGSLLASPWKFARHGRSGVEVSELLPVSRRAR